MKPALLAVFAAAVAFAQTGDGFFFIQMSDPQFGMYAKDREFSQETANYEFAIAAANRLKPRFVIVCGDLVNKPGDASQIAEYKRISAKLDPSIRLYSLPGNHDVGNEPTPESLTAYRERFGPDHYAFREGPVYGIVLNSTLIHTPQKAREAYEEQQSWLATELAKAKPSGAQNIVVFMHHPLFLEKADEPDQYFNIPLERRQPLIDMLREAGVQYVFAGHYHRNAAGSGGGLQVITTGPVGMPLGGAKSGIRAVWAAGGKLENRYFEFGELPASLPPK